MKRSMRAVMVLALAALALPVAAAQSIKIDLSNDTVGAEPKALLPVVGIWRIEGTHPVKAALQ
jgi:hypothetical protein